MLTLHVTAFVVALGAQAAPLPEAEVSRELVEAHMRALPELRAVYVEPERQQGLADTERIIVERLRAMGYEPRLELLDWTTQGTVPVFRDGAWTPVEDPDPRRWHNIVVEIPGRVTPEEVILVGAHFDAVPTTPGADDNASGVSGAMEVARVLRERPMERTVRIVFFNLEEIGLIGSRQHARATRDRVEAGEESLIGMMSIEMIGYFCDEPGCQRSPMPPIPGVFEPSDKGDNIVVVATLPSRAFARALRDGMVEAEPGMEVFMVDFLPGVGQMMPDTRRSDHAPFWDAGFPAVMITDSSEFRNPHYHKPTDTIETLDLDRMTLVVRQIVGGVWRLAGPMDARKNGAE